MRCDKALQEPRVQRYASWYGVRRVPLPCARATNCPIRGLYTCSSLGGRDIDLHLQSLTLCLLRGKDSHIPWPCKDSVVWRHGMVSFRLVPPIASRSCRQVTRLRPKVFSAKMLEATQLGDFLEVSMAT